tara:strand:- start:186 stop:416 length:231 start_codon:yes stop_codon:yes gene_type:complete
VTPRDFKLNGDGDSVHSSILEFDKKEKGNVQPVKAIQLSNMESFKPTTNGKKAPDILGAIMKLDKKTIHAGGFSVN